MKSGMERLYNQIDNRYLVGEMVSLKVGHTGFKLSYHAMQKAQWLTPPVDDRFTPEELIQSRDTVCYFALQDEQVAGQLVLFENWNHLCMVQNIGVDARFRRQGIGKALIDTACDWAKLHGQKGLMAQTQDSNPIACQFLESVGFTLGGVDQLLYTAMPEQQNRPQTLKDSALFFYKLF